jgi:GAF domain-containing protein
VEGVRIPERVHSDDEILILLAAEADRAFVCGAFRHDAYTLCADVGALCAALERGAGAVVVALEALAGADVERLIDAVARQPPGFDPPIVLLAHAGDEVQTRDLLARLGNAIVLERPLAATTLVTAVHAARGARRRQPGHPPEPQREDLLARERAARAAVEAAQQRLDFLTRATAVLAAILEYEATVEAVAGLAIPYLADWCSVDIVDPEGTVRRVAVRHADPTKAPVARQMATYPADPAAMHPRTRVLRTGRSFLARDITEEGLATVTDNPEQLRVMQSLGYRSAMIVALVARGQTLGAITFVMAESGRRYDRADLALAEQLASRAALALDNARLFRDAQQAIAARDAALAEEQAARREAESANTAKDEFLAIVSHELRSPLGVILTWAHLLRRGALDASRAAHAVERIEQSALAQRQMIEDLLDVSRVVAGKL